MGLAGLFDCHIHLVKSFYSLSVVSKSIGSDQAASISDIENNEFQQDAITALHQRVDDILDQVATKSPIAVTKGKELMAKNGMHPFWAFAVTSVKDVGDVL